MIHKSQTVLQMHSGKPTQSMVTNPISDAQVTTTLTMLVKMQQFQPCLSFFGCCSPDEVSQDYLACGKVMPIHQKRLLYINVQYE